MKLTTSFLFCISIIYLSCDNRPEKITQSNKTSRFHALIDSAKATSLDSIHKTLLNRATEEANIIDLDSISEKIYRLQKDFALKSNDSASIKIWNRKLTALSQTTLDTLTKAKIIRHFAFNDFRNGNYLDAALKFDEASKLYLKKSDSAKASSSVQSKAVMQKELGDFKGSEVSSVNALGLMPKLDTITALSAYNNLASTSKEQSNFDEALYWNSLAFELVNTPRYKTLIESNRYNILLNAGRHLEAAESYKALLKKHEGNKTNKNYIRALDHYAEALSHLDDPKAEEVMLEAHNGWLDLNDDNGILYSHLHLANHYLTNTDNYNALKHADAAFNLAETLNDVRAKLEALSYLIKAKDNPKTEAVLFQKLSDSVVKAQQNVQEQFAKIEFDSDKKRQDNLELRAKNAEAVLQLVNAKNRQIWIGVSILIILGFTLFYFSDLKKKHKLARLQVSYDTETNISKKVHDELANDLYNIMTRIEVTENLNTAETKETVLDNLDDVYQRTRDISRETGMIETEAFENELSNLLTSYHNNNQRIITKNLDDIPWNLLSKQKKITLYRVLQELMTNFKKHSEATVASFVFEKHQKFIQINYTDNGVGLGKNERLEKNGLANAENRMEVINGSLKFGTNKGQGLKVTVTCPV